MRRVLVVDDSAIVRSLVSDRLRAVGYEVTALPDAEQAAEHTALALPDVIVTDLMMPGLSGVQLCRLVRSDPATAHIPVLLLSASGDKRTRFWARSAGAAGYLGKDRLDDLVPMLARLVAPPLATPLASGRGRTLVERISAVLDGALFESVVAGEVRALSSAGALPQLFEGLRKLLSDLLVYRWLALLPAPAYAPLYLHSSSGGAEGAERAARSATGAAADRACERHMDEQAAPTGEAAPWVADVVFGGTPVGRIALAPANSGLSRDEERLLSVLASELGGPLQMTMLFEDARRLASTDALTGLLNRRAFLDAMDRERSRAERHAFPLSVLLLDVDHFKRVNDEHGHAGGDAVLRAVAKAVSAVARRSDYVGRWGGEEFVVALPQTGAAGALVAAERIRRGIAKLPFALPGGTLIHVTASVGVASAEAPWSLDAMVDAADEAMYAAKRAGRNRVQTARAPVESSESTRPPPALTAEATAP